MTTIKIITATPGPSTTEQILDLIKSQTTGVTIKEISHHINRPVSMLQVYLKQLVTSKQICATKSQLGDGVNPVNSRLVRPKTIYTIAQKAHNN